MFIDMSTAIVFSFEFRGVAMPSAGEWIVASLIATPLIRG
jgi:hypothetical protein